MSVESILQAATEQQHRMMLAEVTGGEPLLQPESVTLLDRLCSLVPTVLCETNGTVAIPPRSDRRWHAIMDIKCPGSGHHHQMCRDNLQRLAAPDEVKFVISDRADFEWAAATLAELGVLELGITVLFSPVTQTVAPGELARWILESGLHVKFQLQLHKLLWPDVHRGV